MSKLRIKDAPLLPDVDGSEKIPTGGKGDYSVSIEQLKVFAQGGLPQQLQGHIDDFENPHNVTKDQVGLDNVDNTSDADKPISTATQAALNLKANQTYVDTALSQLSTVATKFYPTLAEANADIANIEVNQPVQVGESGANGGLYYKATVGVTSLTKSPYDPLTQSKNYTDEKLTISNAIEANYDSYLVGVGLLGNDVQGGVFTTGGIPPTATSFIIPCLPETDYTLIKSFNSDRFRVAEFETYPKVGDTAYRYSKDEYNSSEEIKPDGTVEFSFRTGNKTAYLVVYTSRDVLPEGLTLTLKKAINKLSVAESFVSNAFYLNRGIFDSSATINALLQGTHGEFVVTPQEQGTGIYSTIIIPVKPDTHYLLLKPSKTNRFRIGEFGAAPSHGDIALTYTDALHDRSERVEVLTGEWTNYLAVYVSNGVALPSDFTLSLSINITGGFKDERIIKGKNLFDPSLAYDQTGVLALVGPEGSIFSIQDIKNVDNNPDAYTSLAVVEVKPNTTYTIQKTASNRFRVGFTSSMPTLGVFAYLAKGEPNDANLTTKVTTSNDTNYMVLYLAKNEDAPSFVQVEEGEVATSKETFGYKLSPLAEAMDISFTGFVNAGIGDGVTDDTEALKIDILMNSGIISFDPNKTYLISDTLEIDIARYHRLNGNGARFVSASPDKPCFRLKGSMVGGHNASPSTNNSYARQQYGFVFDHTIIYGQTVGVGIGVEVTGCLAPTLTNNNIFFLDKGIVFKNTNRDVNLIGNRIWVNKTYGIEFHDSANIHQINIVSNIITYNTVNIIIDNADIYNIQITGNDIETASSGFLNTSGGANIIINAQTGLTEDVTIVGNTLEDHWVSDGMIVLNGAHTNSIASVCIDGNSFGNSNDVEIKMGGCSGVYVGGQFKHSYGATVEATGHIDGLTMNVQSKKTGTKGGLFKCANSSANLKNINISGSQLSGSARKAVDVIANQIQNFVINGNSLKDLSADQASIKIHAESIEGLRVDMNNISENTYSKAIEITANQVIGKNSILFNSAKTGTFEAPDEFNIQGNW